MIVVVEATAEPSGATIEKCVVSVDSSGTTAAKSSGRMSAEGVARSVSIVAARAVPYSSRRASGGMSAKSGSPSSTFRSPYARRIASTIRCTEAAEWNGYFDMSNVSSCSRIHIIVRPPDDGGPIE